MPEASIVAFDGDRDSETLDLTAAEIFVDFNDYEGIHIAARILAQDFGIVTRSQKLYIRTLNDPDNPPDNAMATSAIVVGCIETSCILKHLEGIGAVDFSDIRGKWECFGTWLVDSPSFGHVFGCERALIIAGSDKRGTIYGMYTLSEQIGVSPWHWWADVPPIFHPKIYALKGITISKEPSVRYRGIFINDEAPALTGWVREKFGGYNSNFYQKVFELLLRLKANFLWPAMWPGWPNPGASFFTDDPMNQETADAWGIVISTSHHEPMQRLSNEWLADNPLGTWNWLTNKEKITEFFAWGARRAEGYESYFTMGMRGEYDTKMPAADPAAIVKDVLRTQRQLIKEIYGSEDGVPQLLALYKEVQQQYESGRLDVPDDVTLLFSDDNFGTIRRLPYGDEVNRKGGAGLYYHLEYVGTPRSYKWINSNSLDRILHQLREAHRHHARQIWVFNVGDIKPLEVPLTFALSLAWDITCCDPQKGVEDATGGFLSSLAKQMFQREGAFTESVACMWLDYHQLVSLRRHEHIEPTTFSLLHHREAEDIAFNWIQLSNQAEGFFRNVPEHLKSAIYQLVVHPIRASATFVNLQIRLGCNQLFARQRRNSANKFADHVRMLFEKDHSWTQQYHSIEGGKWNNFLAQPHYGFEAYTWHAPSRDMISGLCYVQTRQDSNPIVGQLGVAVEGHAGVRPGLINENSDFTHPSRGDLAVGLTLGLVTRHGPLERWIDIFKRGTCASVHWRIITPYRWLKPTLAFGILDDSNDSQRVVLRVDWNEVHVDFDEEVPIEIRSREGDFEQVRLPVTGRRQPPSFRGQPEQDGVVCIHAEETLQQIVPAGPNGENDDENMRNVSSSSRDPALISDPATASSGWLPSPQRQLESNIYLFSDPSMMNGQARMLFYFRMTLDYHPANPMTYQFSFDHGGLETHRLLEAGDPEEDPELPSPQGWLTAVQDGVWVREHDLTPFDLTPGAHILTVRLLHTNIVLERIVLDLGGFKEGYRGGPLRLPMRHSSPVETPWGVEWVPP